MKCFNVCLCIFLSIFCTAQAENQAQPGDGIIQRPLWKTMLSYNNWTDEEPAVMRMSDGYLVVGLSTYMAGNDFQRKVILWKIDLDGKELWVKEVNLPEWQTGKPFAASRCFSLHDDPTLLLVSASTLKAWLLRFDDTGSIVFSKGFLPGQVFDIQGMRKTVDGFLLYGSVHKGNQNSDACVLKLGTDGSEIWRREYDKGKMEWGTGLAPQKNGGFVLSADSGIYNKFGGGPSEAWIVKCDPNGEILKEAIFEGRHPSVVGNGDVTAVIFNKENFPQQDMAVVGLDNELKTLWRIDSLFGKAGGLGMLASMVNKQGNFILAGSKLVAAEFWEISKEGKILRSIEIEGAEDCVKFDSLLQTPNGYLVAGSGPKMSEMLRTSDGKRDKNVQWDMDDILICEVPRIEK